MCSGVAAQETYHDFLGQTYIDAAYVKYLESAGARVVPIRYYIPFELLSDIF